MKLLRDLLPPILLLAVLTVIIAHFGLDLRLQALFYQHGTGWFMGEKPLWMLLYKYGNIPALLCLFGSIIILILGFWMIPFIKFRKMALLFILVIVIGPGLFVNMIFKDHWGRPRPREIVQFDGTMQFCESYQIGVPGKGKSFPCGHASIGFVLFVPAFFFRKRHKIRSIILLTAGLAYGTLMGIGRMVQGGHFASDVIWSAGLVYLTAIGIFYLLGMDKDIYWEKDETQKKHRGLITAFIIMISLLIFIGLLLATPNQAEMRSTPTDKVKINHYYFNETDLSFGSMGGIYWKYSGFGFPKSRIIPRYRPNGSDVEVRFQVKGFFTELQCKTVLDLAASFSQTNIINIRKGSVFIDPKELSQTKYLEISLEKGDVTLQTAQQYNFRLIVDESKLIGQDISKLQHGNNQYFFGTGKGPVIKIIMKNGHVKIIL